MPNKFEEKLDILMGVNEPGITLRKVISIVLSFVLILALLAFWIWMMWGPWQGNRILFGVSFNVID